MFNHQPPLAQGSEHLRKVPTGSPALVMFSHASNLDPFVLTSSTPLGVQWIGKRSLFLMPIFGWAALAAGMVPVNRSNRAKAIASLNAMKVSARLSATHLPRHATPPLTPPIQTPTANRHSQPDAALTPSFKHQPPLPTRRRP